MVDGTEKPKGKLSGGKAVEYAPLVDHHVSLVQTFPTWIVQIYQTTSSPNKCTTHGQPFTSKEQLLRISSNEQSACT
jgi:hypothetical protein